MNVRTIGGTSGLRLMVDPADLTMRRESDGTITARARIVSLKGKRYTPRGLYCYLLNEVFRKNTANYMRTTSHRKRAGSRRTKKHARATR